jgi:hypothetical protein
MSSVLPLEAFRHRLAALRERAVSTQQSLQIPSLTFLSAGRFAVEWPEGDAVTYAIPPDAPRLSNPGIRAWLREGGSVALGDARQEVQLPSGLMQSGRVYADHTRSERAMLQIAVGMALRGLR